MSPQKNQARSSELSIFSKLYRGETDVPIVPSRKKLYIAGAVLMTISVIAILFKGFTLGIDFVGGVQYAAPVSSTVSLEDVEEAVEDAGVPVSSAQRAGSGDAANYVIRAGVMSDEETAGARQAITSLLGIETSDVSVTEVSSTWGQAVSQQALVALLVFIALVTLFIWLRFEKRMAVAALASLIFDLVLVAGVFAIVGFEVTPSTLVGMLMVLAYSLYDTVVVFDKLRENTEGLLQSRRQTFAEAANDAVNLTLMRSINTSIIGALPVGGLLFIGVGMLGVGTLKDLALVLFVGVITGTFSSVFLAAPLVVDLANRSPVYQKHNQKVANKRAGISEDGDEEDDVPDRTLGDESDNIDLQVDEVDADEGERSAAVATTTPRPGVRPASRGSRGSRSARSRRD
ncbi:protein translocase subunit SecF [Natronoglycomyces albus]|uniref:Protein-export membrane protein SecF n=1 Tax=Natronoglycomyces albus TaxID=2811108 RepID=A0A895XNE3_9ACTN|nr:protein translocase subunit SecF [Natronoglycomyces albus]QSB04006.1 protein translocase subunit SecF [Natronoglycomyces albus]